MMAMSIQVIDRLARLLDIVAEHDGPIGLKQLAHASGLHPSTTFRILAALAEHGFIERDASGAYRLGLRLLELGSRVQGGLDIRREARPILEWLERETGETVNLIMREGDEVVYVDRVAPKRMMRVEQPIGGHIALHVTAVGKLFLAEAGADACLAYAKRTGLPAATPHSITDPAKLWHNVKDALAQGYALDNQEAELEVGCIGVPVRDSSARMVAGISVSAPFGHRRQDWIAVAKQAGDRLSARLGYRGHR